MAFHFKKREVLFLLGVFAAGVCFRLIPRLSLDPHLLTFQADIWYRLCLAQFLIDHGRLPEWDIRYIAYGHVPLWYNPLSIYFFAFLHQITHWDLPTVSSRVMPFIESLSGLSIYFLCRKIYNKRVAVLATCFFLLSPSYLFWTGISTLQSFTVFLVPLMILLWIKFLREEFILNKWTHLVVMGILLSVNFLTHLSYFTHLIMLVCVQIGLMIEKKARLRDCLFLSAPILLSQIFTIFWWLPRNLYWWWTKGLTTSTGFFEGIKFLTEYGVSTAIIGHLAFAVILLLVLFQRRWLPEFCLVPIFWALFPLLESHNEGFLTLFKHMDLSWNNFFKPLEGFRFYVFLTQPLAVCFALLADRLVDSFLRKDHYIKRFLLNATALLLCGVLLYDIFFVYHLPSRFQVSGIETRDIKAARWFRENTPSTARILADYYYAQMFSGICGGKALLGEMFPLKGTTIPYISEKTRVQSDIYSVYLKPDPQSVRDVFHRYGVTHIYISNNSLSYIESLSSTLYGKKTTIERDKLRQTFADPKLFKAVYKDADLQILQLIEI